MLKKVRLEHEGGFICNKVEMYLMQARQQIESFPLLLWPCFFFKNALITLFSIDTNYGLFLFERSLDQNQPKLSFVRLMMFHTHTHTMV
jgi:hypothetical protein